MSCNREYLAKNGFRSKPCGQDAVTQIVLPEPLVPAEDGETFLCVLSLPGILLLLQASMWNTELCVPDAIMTSAFISGGRRNTEGLTPLWS